MLMPRRRAVSGLKAECVGRRRRCALVGGVVAGEDLDQRRLAGAVLAEQGEHAAASGVEVHAVEDLDAAERLPDPRV